MILNSIGRYLVIKLQSGNEIQEESNELFKAKAADDANDEMNRAVM